MGKTKKELLVLAPWRIDGDEAEAQKFKDAKLKVTNQPGSTPTMHVPGKKKAVSSKAGVEDEDDFEIDPEFRYSFQRNFQVLTFSEA